MVALLYILSFLSLSIPSVFSFSFTVSTPTECDDLTVEWQGGTGPFSLLIAPVFGVQRNVSIPDSAFSGGKGTFTMALPLAKDKRFVLTMSDSTGFATGGTTEVMSVGSSTGGTCSTADPAIAFGFQLNSALQQCRAFSFTGFQSAAQPVTIWMVVPGGTSQVVRPGSGSSYSWTANVAAGTSMIFMMTDAQGRAGGASDLLTVGASDVSSCLNNQSPSSTAKPTTATSTSNASRTSTSSSSDETAPPAATTTSASGVPISAIAGTVIGSLLFLAVIVTLGLFFLKNMQKKARQRKEAKSDFRKSRRMPSDGTFFGGPPPANPYGSPPTGVPQYYPYSANSTTALDNPFADGTGTPMNDLTPAGPQSQFALQQSLDPFQASPAQRPYYTPSPSLPPLAPQDPFNPLSPALPRASAALISSPPESEASRTVRSEETSSSQRKAAMAGVTAYTPSRFIVHTDAEDELPPPSEDGIVELPPQYTERRPGPKRKLSVMNPSRPSADSELSVPYPNPPAPLNPSTPNVSPFS